MKPYYETELGQLYHGDCLEIMPHLPKVDLVLTDIPYDGVNRGSNGLRCLDKKDADKKTFELCDYLPALTNAKSYYIFCGWRQISEIFLYFENKGLSIRRGVWEKTNPSPMNGEYIWLSSAEYFVFAKDKGATYNGFCRSPVLRFPTARDQQHPTQKPTLLFQEILLVSSNENDTVLDTCIGSGTTPYVCERLNRKWIGIELSEEYCEIAAQRIENERKQRKLF